MQTSSFTGRVVSAVNGFLHIAARFFQNLPHFARHVGGETILIANQNFAEAKKYFGASGSGRAAPTIKGALCRIDRRVYIVAG